MYQLLTSHFSPKKKVKEEKISFDPLHILYILNSLVKSQPTTHPDSTHDSQLTVILSEVEGHNSQPTTQNPQLTIHDSRFTIHCHPELAEGHNSQPITDFIRSLEVTQVISIFTVVSSSVFGFENQELKGNQV